MKHMMFLFAVIMLLMLTDGTGMAQGGLETLDQHGTERVYSVRLPDNYDDTQRYPVMIALHGYGGSAIEFQTGTMLDDLVFDAGWISVFPEGINAAWYYLDEQEMLADGQYQNDIEFMALLLDDLATKYAIDPDRVMVVGFSNGGLMALRMGCDLSERLAGVIAIAANYAFELAQHCLDAEPIAEMLIWGSADEVFPFNGMAVVSDGVMRSSFSQNQLRSYLSSRHGCQPEAVSVETARSTYRVLSITFTRCSSGKPALLYLIGDLGHSWLPDGIEINLLNPGTTGDMEAAIFEFLELVRANIPNE
jgi:polyhydroxybutyrate depolymerase